MARTSLAVQDATDAGLAATYSAFTTGANNGFMVNPASLLHIKNATGGTATFTVVTPGAPAGLAIPDKTFTVATATDRFYTFTNPVFIESDNTVYIDCDVAATIASLNAA
jgi:hypothetical protein